MKRMRLALNIIAALLTFTLGVVVVTRLASYRPARIQIARDAPDAQTNEETRKVEDADSGCLDPNLPKPKIVVRFSVLNSKAVELPGPEYPAEAKAADVSGEVKAVIVVDEEGRVAWARIQSGHHLLRPAVKKVVCQSRFKPGKVGGHPVKVNGMLTYRFVLP